MALEFNPATGQYRDTETKRFVDRATVLSTIDGEISKLKTSLQGIARLYQSGRIDLEEFQRRIADRIKVGTIQAASIGSGGAGRLNNQVLGAVGQRLRNRYGHLRNFAQAIKDGEVSEKQLLNRAGQYSEVYRAAFFDAEKRTRQNIGFNQAMRGLDSSAQHCPECLKYTTNNKWLPSDEVIPPGTLCSCHGRCRCWIRYRRFVPQTLMQAILR